MPYTNLFKNCGYYWGFAAFVSYFVNHPLYTPPNTQISAVLFGLAMLCQLANFRQATPSSHALDSPGTLWSPVVSSRLLSAPHAAGTPSWGRIGHGSAAAECAPPMLMQDTRHPAQPEAAWREGVRHPARLWLRPDHLRELHV